MLVTSLHCFTVSKVSRATGRTAVAAAAYRSGERLHDDRNGRWHDFRARTTGGEIAECFIRTPEGAGWALDRPTLWNAAEAREVRSNSVTAREFLIALPAELDGSQRRDLADAFAGELVERYGVAVDVCVHRPSKTGDQRNHHAHLLATTRRVDGSGLLEKTRELDDKVTGPQEITALRQLLADVTNQALERARAERRVDPRSHVARGLDEAPQRKDGPLVTYYRRQAEEARTSVEGSTKERLDGAEAEPQGRSKARQLRSADELRAAAIAKLEGALESLEAQLVQAYREVEEAARAVARKAREVIDKGVLAGRKAGDHVLDQLHELQRFAVGRVDRNGREEAGAPTGPPASAGSPSGVAAPPAAELAERFLRSSPSERRADPELAAAQSRYVWRVARLLEEERDPGARARQVREVDAKLADGLARGHAFTPAAVSPEDEARVRGERFRVLSPAERARDGELMTAQQQLLATTIRLRVEGADGDASSAILREREAEIARRLAQGYAFAPLKVFDDPQLGVLPVSEDTELAVRKREQGRYDASGRPRPGPAPEVERSPKPPDRER